MKKLLWLSFSLMIVMVGCVTKGEVKPSPSVVEDEITEPPNLIVKVNNQEIQTVKGNYSWSYDISENEEMNKMVGGLSPYEMVDLNDAQVVQADTEVQLNFDINPIEYEVKIWENQTVVYSFEQFQFPDEKGKYIYEILAKWEQGEASYVFALDIQ